MRGIMQILLTNDDGIHAEGIKALYAALAQVHTVTVVAPHVERSAGSHAITLHDPIRVVSRKTNAAGDDFFAISGTSADCVKLGYLELAPRPDLVISGINAGVNDGVNICYSGTVAAALEASLYGIPALAVSMPGRYPAHYATAAAFASWLTQRRGELGLSPRIVLNVNVPDLSADEISGVMVTRQDMAVPGDWVEQRRDPRNGMYYWYGYRTPGIAEGSGTDREALSRNCISITPLKAERTASEALDSLRGQKFDWYGKD